MQKPQNNHGIANDSVIDVVYAGWEFGEVYRGCVFILLRVERVADAGADELVKLFSKNYLKTFFTKKTDNICTLFLTLFCAQKSVQKVARNLDP
jgi:hypothetical protein